MPHIVVYTRRSKRPAPKKPAAALAMPVIATPGGRKRGKRGR
jgi:hypothetical protein